MKQWLKKIGFSVASAAVLLTGITSVARADTTNTVLSGLITPSSQEDTTTIDQRLAARRAKVQLSTADRANVVAKCSLAQTAINDVRTKDTKAAATRLQTYNDLVKRLSFLVDNLSAQGNDATAINNAQSYFVATINNYLNDAETYKVAMDDAVTVDCQSDPAGFMATLTEARADRAKLNPDVAAIKSNLNNLEKNLADARQQLIVKGQK